MACISKLAAGFAYDCDTGATGIKNAIIINKEDIASIIYNPSSPSLVSGITLVSGAKAYKIDTPKKTLVVTESLKTNEGAPNALSFSVSLTITENDTYILRDSVLTPLLNSGLVLVVNSGVSRRIYGLYYGLYTSAYDRSTAENGGWVTVTLSTPDNVIGEDPVATTSDLYDSLYEAAVY